MRGANNPFWMLWPFWAFILLYKIGAALHYSLNSPLGEKVVPLWAVGIAMGLAAGIQLVLDVPAGFLLDRLGYRRLLRIGTSIFLVAISCLFFELTPTTYFLTLGISALGWLFFMPGISAYILAAANPENAGRFMSMRDTFNSLGTVGGAIIFPLAIILPVPYTAGIMFFFLAASLLALWLTPKEKTSVHTEKKIATQHYHVRRDYLGKVIRAMKHLDPASSLLVLQGFSASVFYATVWFVVPIMIVRTGNNLLSLGLGIFDFAIVALGFLFGTLADRWNKRLLILGGLLVFAVTGVFLGFNFNWWFLVLGFIATSGDELSSLSLWAWLDNIKRDHTENGLISGAISFTQDLGWAIGPVMAGFLFVSIGPTWTIVAGSLMLFLTWTVSVARTTIHPGISSVVAARYAKPHRPRHKT